MPWQSIFFAVNFSLAVLMLITGVGAILTGESHGSFCGGILLLAPAAIVAIAEWRLYVRRVTRLERPLGIFSGAVGALAIFGFISNAAEAIVQGNAPGLSFWLIFGGVCLIIGAYGLWCAWLRVRRRTFADAAGFDVILPSIDPDEKRRR